MNLRLRALASVDPLSVPLPNGTEVSTRVDRPVGDRVVPQGAIGRVLSTSGARVMVKIIGVGPLEYLREEVVPRRSGELHFAARRAAAFEQLHGNIVLETIVGSHAWGLADAGSDVDRRGVFALPFSWTTGLDAPPEDLVGADASTGYWEVKKTLRQALRGDPNTLECLFLPSARALDPIGERLLAERQAFVSRELYASFGRYALSQLAKLSQSLRLAEHRSALLTWLRADPSLSLDALAARLARETIIEATSERAATLRAKEYIKQVYRSLFDQGTIPRNELSALAELAVREGATSAAGPGEDQPGAESSGLLGLPRELRPKNAYNLLRLIRSAIDWLETGQPCFEVTGAFKERLLSIKRGEVPLDEVLRDAEAMTPELERARACEVLPPKPDRARVDRLHREIQEELARRFVDAIPGPFGRDAPEPPPPEAR